MKKEIHPEYMECQVRCSCGNTFTTKATKPELHVELCNECHPFFTGQQKFVDTGGRVQRFSDKFGGSSANAVLEREQAAKEARKAEQEAKAEAEKNAREAKAAEKAARAAEYEKKAAKKKKDEPKDESTEAPVDSVDSANEQVVAETAVSEEGQKPEVQAEAPVEDPEGVAPEAAVEAEVVADAAEIVEEAEATESE